MIAYLYKCEQQGHYQWKPLDMPCWVREGIDMLKYVINTKQQEQAAHASRVNAAKARMH